MRPCKVSSINSWNGPHRLIASSVSLVWSRNKNIKSLQRFALIQVMMIQSYPSWKATRFGFTSSPKYIFGSEVGVS